MAKKAKTRFRPLTVHQQLVRLAELHKTLTQGTCPNRAISDAMLGEAWEALQKTRPYQLNPGYLLRGKTHGDMPPLAQLFDYVESGHYPPPELLLILYEAWMTYRESGGTVDLEEAFFGRRKPNAGNYAGRYLSERRKIAAGIALSEKMATGLSKTDTAAELAGQYGVSATSLERTKPLNFDWADFDMVNPHSKPGK